MVVVQDRFKSAIWHLVYSQEKVMHWYIAVGGLLGLVFAIAVVCTTVHLLCKEALKDRE